jgi:hypothetical protein
MLTLPPACTLPPPMELLARSGSDAPRRIEVVSWATGAELREKLRVGGDTRMYFQGKLIKATDILERLGVTTGATVSLNERALGSFATDAERQSAQRLKRGAIKRSTAHKHLHAETQGVVNARADAIEAKLGEVTALLAGHPPPDTEGETAQQAEVRMRLVKHISAQQLKEVAVKAAEERRLERQRLAAEHKAGKEADRAACTHPRKSRIGPARGEKPDGPGEPPEPREDPQEDIQEPQKEPALARKNKRCGECDSCLHPKRKRGCLQRAAASAAADAPPPPPPVDTRSPHERWECDAMSAEDVRSDAWRNVQQGDELLAEMNECCETIRMENADKASRGL